MSDSREHILDTAARLFMQKSYKDVTMKEIVDQTGMSKGAVYHHFTSKEELFGEIVDQYFLKAMQVPFHQLPQDSLKSFYEGFLKILAKSFRDHMAKIVEVGGTSFNYYMLMFDALKLYPGFREKIMKHNDEELKAWTGIVRKAKASGEVRSKMGDKQIARLFIFITDGIGMRLIMEGKPEKVGREILTLWDELYSELCR